MCPRPTSIIGVESGYGSGNSACQDGPRVLKMLGVLGNIGDAQHVLRWREEVPSSDVQDKALGVAHIASQLAVLTYQRLLMGERPLILGGDHSCAIGTWSGVKHYLGETGRLGMIWIDAHMDSHTFATSPSQNIHGMPLACLLGYGDPCFTDIAMPGQKLLPEDVCLIGVRSFEKEEAALLKQLGVRVYFMDEVAQRGMQVVFDEARQRVSEHTQGYGISLDLDAIDPSSAPGVSTPVVGGLQPQAVAEAISSVSGDDKLLALEIVEYNPALDRHFITAGTIRELCQALVLPQQSSNPTTTRTE
jgi:arginase